MLTACSTPDLITEITLQPVRRHGVDAAILFSDIVVPLRAVGVDVEIVPGTGPVIADPIRSASQLAALRRLSASDVPYVTEAVTNLVAELGDTPLIGFAGAPFTLASYLVEGGPSREHGHTKALMHSAPEVWHELCDRLADISLEFLRAQIAAGASAVQLFDSWAGALSERDYRRYVAPHSARIFTGLAELGVPRIHFGVATGHLLTSMAATGADVIGVDWRTPLPTARASLGDGYALQGNLDPALLLADFSVVEAEARRIVEEGVAVGSHIFNLGHGVLPQTDPGVLTELVALVHSYSRERRVATDPAQRGDRDGGLAARRDAASRR